MTATEFNKQLWPYAVARFSEIDFYLGQHPTERRHERDVTQRDVIAAWQGILADVPLDFAKKALDVMARGDTSKPKNLSDFPTMIRIEAKKFNREQRITQSPARKAKIIDGEWAYLCPLCEDTGMVVVWHPEAHKAAREKPEQFIEHNAGGYQCAVACGCELGQSTRNGGLTFDGRKMVPVPGILQATCIESRRQLVAIMAERDANQNEFAGAFDDMKDF